MALQLWARLDAHVFEVVPITITNVKGGLVIPHTYRFVGNYSQVDCFALKWGVDTKSTAKMS
jgi:hypothetical protein